MKRKKTVAITGGLKGIGFAAAQLFNEHDYNLSIFDADQSATQTAQQQLGKEVLITSGRVENKADLADWYKATDDRFSGLDTVVVNAGRLGPGPIESLTDELIDDVIAVNFKGVIYTIQQALPYLSKGSNIVVVSSIGGEVGITQPLYGATKAAVTSLTKSVAGDLIKKGIRVNSVSPGTTQTPMFASSMEGGDATSAAILDSVPIGRIADPMEIAKVIYFLASDESSYIVGENIIVDGGFINIR